MSDHGYIDYYAILELPADAKPGEVRKIYRKKIKQLLIDISKVEMTAERRDHFLLDMARQNAAFYVLRENDRREQYDAARQQVMALEAEWREKNAADPHSAENERLRRSFDAALRHFLSKYVEELMLEAGRDPEVVEASNWDAAHERHASKVLRLFRQRQYHEIQERLPFYEVTKPNIDWEERQRAAAALIVGSF